MSDLTSRYAKAFLDAGGNDAELRQASDLLTENAELWEAMLNPTIPTVAKQRVLRRIPGMPESKELIAFLRLLTEKGRMILLHEIARDTHILQLEKYNSAVGTITFARKPTEQQLEDIKSKLCEMRHLVKVELNVSLDESLLGGFTLELGGVTYDKSVRGALNELKRNIRER